MAAQGEGHSKWLHRRAFYNNQAQAGAHPGLTGSHYPKIFTLLSKHSHTILTHQASPNDLP